MKTSITSFVLCLITGLLCSFHAAGQSSDDHEKHEWFQNPPADADSLPVFISYAEYDKNLNVVKKNETGFIKYKEKKAYLPFARVRSSPGWIEATIRSGVMLEFPDDQIVVRYHYKAIQYPAGDTIFKTENYGLRGVNNFSPQHIEFRQIGDRGESTTNVTYKYTPLKAFFNRETGLVYKAKGGFVIDRMSWWNKGDMVRYENTASSEGPVVSLTMPTQVVAGFILGKVANYEPESLTEPLISVRWSIFEGHYKHAEYSKWYIPEIDIQLNIVNPDNTLIDSNKLFIKLWIDGEEMPEYSFNDYGNPYGYPCVYAIKLRRRGEQDIPPIHGYCYYLKDDGTKIESPEFRYDPAGINLPAAPDEELQECQTFDLTGRPVNGENLSPGIYIRNGRKFVVY